MPRPRKDITGQVFERITVLEDKDHGKNPEVLCQCSCGTKFTAKKHNIIRGNTKSCGCYRAEKARDRRLKKVTNITDKFEKSSYTEGIYDDDDDFNPLSLEELRGN